ncbi:DUF4430 domain-containing protein [Lentilactobacillus kisonensis]|uniref:Transcobalamin-like C-terminal domain-containing protein n=1 Tax=Lentilactobacillus kisonensis DSM 19906 = JCM 15041 TaxID=1423766 RepID=A0A0R1NV19_9LACO|nr:DUF4430 domain-containing protein [Lentilactobacillus kisonensis]KRL22148.1 hypothetical protein FC98_GL002765 [Lentilactobacillus kisonensis DSM 19906 = JCM 15041]
MKKGRIVGIILAFILVVGIGFGVQQVMSTRADHKPVSAISPKSAASSSSQAASKSSNVKPNSKQHHAKKQSHQPKTSSTTHHSNSTNSTNNSSVVKSAASSNQPTQDKVTTSTKFQAAQTTKRSNTSPARKNHRAKKAAAKDNSIGTAYIKVSGYKKTLYAGHVKISKSATAFSVLQQTHLKLVYQSSPHVYVSSINGLKQNDIKVGSGWMYSVNSKFVDKGADQKRITPGDKVHWYFSVNGLNGK